MKQKQKCSFLVKLNELKFNMDEHSIAIVKSYKYLNILFTNNGKFKEGNKYLCNLAQKSMFSLLKKEKESSSFPQRIYKKSYIYMFTLLSVRKYTVYSLIMKRLFHPSGRQGNG